MTYGAEIVISGIALEAPGGATSVPALWDCLTGPTDVLVPMPRDRGWDIDELLTIGERPGWQAIPDSCGLMPAAATWDGPAFGVSPREAMLIDPHQRVAARCAVRTAHSAGLQWGNHDLHEAGTVIATLRDDYGPPFGRPTDLHGDLLVGGSLSAVAGRVSHVLDLRGPSMTIDVGCAGFLTALDQAATLVRGGTAPAMFAGGVSVLCSPGMFLEFSRLGALAADGHCRPFHPDHPGTAWAEGCVIALVETADSARQAGRTPLAVLRASATTHGGARSSMQVPSGAAQEEAIQACFAAMDVPISEIGVVEAHGTGTPTGDPIELGALAATYGEAAVAAGTEVIVHSSKGHLGHAQAAASGLGLCGLMAAAEHGWIPSHLESDSPALTPGPGLRLATGCPWPKYSGWCHAGVTALGINGTVTHAVFGFPMEESS
ncbi:polyketide synthase [Corynebacterium sp. TAE3-ERU12]|uniref:beta-ketoacyl [acyl carrier protein] synthase domain-containing protein n=1 Tax=Corynebacterium sp. TAE3-ERU12 TaxID=2849491 RepID=UPI001C4482C7|nr:polyketide synthase [Corynebacterium sp. TAE3-ERU12]MBV7294659.1 polyketide synthase [Corynebacterium sp. TAE3-ERU12]